MRPTEEIKQKIENAKIKINPAVKKAALAELINELESSKIKGLTENRPNMWRIIMKSKKIKFAAMVVIIFVIVIGIFQFDKTSMALGQVKTAIHTRLLHLKELVTGTKQSIPPPSSGQRGVRSGRREQPIVNNERPVTLSKKILVNLLFLSIEGKQKELNDFFNKEKIKLTSVRSKPELWHTKLSSEQVEPFRELAYRIDEPELRAKPVIMIKNGEEGIILRSSGKTETFAFSIVANIIDDSDDIELSLASLFGESEIEISSMKIKSDEAVLLCLTTSRISQNGLNDNNNPENKISTLVLIQTKVELPK